MTAYLIVLTACDISLEYIDKFVVAWSDILWHICSFGKNIAAFVFSICLSGCQNKLFDQ